MSTIEMGHGSGGKRTGELIRNLFLKHLDAAELRPLEDASYISLDSPEAAITTDSYVIRPLFFPGGDIGKLSVCGTVNDLTVSGARARYLTLGLIIEEGFSIESLDEILASISRASREASVSVVAGDTKVVERGKCDGLYINTSGVGRVVRAFHMSDVSVGDKVILTGTIGEHGTAVALSREEFEIETAIESDCASLNGLLEPLFDLGGVKWMRDPTRGGVATVLAELADGSGLGIEISQENLPVREDTRFIADMLGYDPLYLANEGKAIIITSEGTEEVVMGQLREHPLGKKSAVIGEITSLFRGVRLRTSIGGVRSLEPLDAEMLPRIC
jgi:hydrogenase expression/formation protein HypE